jgi:hypothetical protein
MVGWTSEMVDVEAVVAVALELSSLPLSDSVPSESSRSLSRGVFGTSAPVDGSFVSVAAGVLMFIETAALRMYCS